MALPESGGEVSSAAAVAPLPPEAVEPPTNDINRPPGALSGDAAAPAIPQPRTAPEAEATETATAPPDIRQAIATKVGPIGVAGVTLGTPSPAALSAAVARAAHKTPEEVNGEFQGLLARLVSPSTQSEAIGALAAMARNALDGVSREAGTFAVKPTTNDGQKSAVLAVIPPDIGSTPHHESVGDRLIIGTVDVNGRGGVKKVRKALSSLGLQGPGRLARAATSIKMRDPGVAETLAAHSQPADAGARHELPETLQLALDDERKPILVDATPSKSAKKPVDGGLTLVTPRLRESAVKITGQAALVSETLDIPSSRLIGAAREPKLTDALFAVVGRSSTPDQVRQQVATQLEALLQKIEGKTRLDEDQAAQLAALALFVRRDSSDDPGLEPLKARITHALQPLLGDEPGRFHIWKRREYRKMHEQGADIVGRRMEQLVLRRPGWPETWVHKRSNERHGFGQLVNNLVTNPVQVSYNEGRRRRARIHEDARVVGWTGGSAAGLSFIVHNIVTNPFRSMLIAGAGVVTGAVAKFFGSKTGKDLANRAWQKVTGSMPWATK